MSVLVAGEPRAAETVTAAATAERLSPATNTLDSDGPIVVYRDMLPIDRAVDLFLGDCARRGYSDRTRTTYSRMLNKFMDYLPVAADVSEVKREDIERFLGTFTGISPKTRRPYAQGSLVQADAPLRSFFKWLEDTERIKRSPMAKLKKPKRPHPEDLDVVTVSSEDVGRMLDACRDWRERLALNLLIYTGSRRRAIAWLRLSDYDRIHKQLRFREKGAKTIWKPVPDELGDLLDAAIAAGVYMSGDDYLVPAAGPLKKELPDRADRVIWDIVKAVAGRCGIRCHVHALRAAFAVFYADNEIGDLDDLREHLGHRSPATTLLYLRRRDRDRQRNKVRSLSWRQMQQVQVDSLSSLSAESFVMGAGGFEPPQDESGLDKGQITLRGPVGES